MAHRRDVGQLLIPVARRDSSRRRDDSIADLHESAPTRDRALQRHRNAGAEDVALLRIPGGKEHADTLYRTRVLEGYSHAVVLEGDNPLGSSDLCVFVTPAFAPGEKLLVRRTRNRAVDHPARSQAFETVLIHPHRVERLFAQVLGPQLARPSPW